jgi:hypothetical protein
MKNAFFWDINPSSYLTADTLRIRYIDISQLMLCKIWGFLGSDYEECRLLGYRDPVTLCDTCKNQDPHGVTSSNLYVIRDSRHLSTEI